MNEESVDIKSREIGDVYVLAGLVHGRRIKPWSGRAWRAWAYDLIGDADVLIPDHLMDRASDLMDDEKKTVVRTIRWFDAAYSAILSGNPVPARKKDTWERVLRVLVSAGEHGATCREVQDQTGLGHGTVSQALSMFQQSGRIERLA